MTRIFFNANDIDGLILNLDVLCSIPLQAIYLDKSRRGARVSFRLALSREPRPGTKIYDVVVEDIQSTTPANGDGTRAVQVLEKAASRMAEPRGVVLQNITTRSGKAFGEKLKRCCGYTPDATGMNYYSHWSMDVQKESLPFAGA
jgi:hypothetical protein